MTRKSCFRRVHFYPTTSDNRAELPAELAQAPSAVRTYVWQQIHELLAHPAFAEALSRTIPHGADYTYQQTLHQRLRELANGS